jgi:hypothetical protein
LIDAPTSASELLSEVNYKGISAHGLTMADLVARDWQQGWVIGLSWSDARWAQPEIEASRFVLTDNGTFEGPQSCRISHISTTSHVNHWRRALIDWGALVSPSSWLVDIAGHPLVMYSAPREHNPPHIHLLESSSSSKTLAKYRIDVFERASGPPTWDVRVGEWVTEHRKALMRSWMRCQTGGKPYTID